MGRRVSKTSKTGETYPVWGVGPVNSHIKLRFLLTGRSGRTLRTLFPPAGSAIFRSEAAKKDLARKPNSKHAFLSESRNMLKMRVSRAFFSTISKSKGSKTPKTVEQCPILKLGNAQRKLQLCAYKAIWPNPPNPFPPAKSAIFRSDVAQKSL